MFVIVITAFLFVWRHFYEIVLVSLEEDEIKEEGSFVELDPEHRQSRTSANKGLVIRDSLLDNGQKNGSTM